MNRPSIAVVSRATGSRIIAARLAVCAIPVAAMVVSTQPAPFEVRLEVVVSAEGDSYVNGLGMADFTVDEDGARQTLLAVERTPEAPLGWILLLDTSNSLEGGLSQIQRVASDLVSRITPHQEAALFAFGPRLTTLHDFTTDRPALARAITGARQQGATALFTSIYTMLDHVEKRAIARPASRNVIVVFSDGRDTSSVVSIDAALDAARRGESAIYAVDVDASDRNRGHGTLRRFAWETGGALLLPETPDDVARLADRIVADVASRYTIRYQPTNQQRDGAFRRLEVKVSRPGADVRTRPGYVADRNRRTE